MKPITFSCEALLPQAPAEIAAQILDVSNWTDFTGYGIIPGIASAEFETRTDDVVGSRIRVINKDGSTHIEEIVVWEIDKRLRLDMKEFSPPLSRLASGFEESWEFNREGELTHAVRSFIIYPRSFLTRPLLRFVSIFLRKAIARHLEFLRGISSQSVS
jgi:hypothetical protein